MVKKIKEEKTERKVDKSKATPSKNENVNKETVAVKESEVILQNSVEKIEDVEITAKEVELNAEEQAQEEYESLRAEAKWYVLHTFSSYENVAKENLEIVVDKYNLQNRVFDIIIPMEDVMEEKNGKRKIVSRKLIPGYIIVKMIYGDDIWHAITRTRGITGFVGPKGRPLALTTDEIRKMKLEKVEVVNIDVAVGDKVEVLEGALYGFVGEIISLDIVANKCRVLVEMFGRETPVDLTLEQIRKLNQ